MSMYGKNQPLQYCEIIRLQLIKMKDKNFFDHAAQHLGSQFPNQGSNPCLLQWKREVLTTGPPGKSLFTLYCHLLSVQWHYVLKNNVHTLINKYFIVKPSVSCNLSAVVISKTTNHTMNIIRMIKCRLGRVTKSDTETQSEQILLEKRHQQIYLIQGCHTPSVCE